MAMRELRSGLPSEEDWHFRCHLALLIADAMIKRYEQKKNS
jgi:hypothetical protein